MCVLYLGNCFGTGGIELLRESLEAKGCLEALGSLSDDEGSDEEEEEGESEGEEANDDTVMEEEKNGDEENRRAATAKETVGERREDRVSVSR